MSWRQFELQMERDRRRSEREAMRHYREAVRRQKEAEKRAQKEQVAEEVARFESYLEVLQSLHKESGPDWNWEEISKRPPPQAPQPITRREDTARRLLAAYKPGFFARLFGSAQDRMRELKIAVTTGKAKD